jgi:hypothetical protein
MNAEQRALYFGNLWPAACAVQGWKKSDEGQRKRVIFAATGETSSSALDEDQITLLFVKLRWLADPANFDKALADSDPAAALAENKRKQLIWRIEKAAALIPGDAEAALAEMAAGKCAVHGVSEWRKLPTPELLRFSFTVSARTTGKARMKRAAKAAKTAPASAVQAACQGTGVAVDDIPF